MTEPSGMSEPSGQQEIKTSFEKINLRGANNKIAGSIPF
jgi:hypothetical protein